jgi:hypothetical protein
MSEQQGTPTDVLCDGVQAPCMGILWAYGHLGMAFSRATDTDNQ